jgi:hypothetical protein
MYWREVVLFYALAPIVGVALLTGLLAGVAAVIGDLEAGPTVLLNHSWVPILIAPISMLVVGGLYWSQAAFLLSVIRSVTASDAGLSPAARLPISLALQQSRRLIVPLLIAATLQTVVVLSGLGLAVIPGLIVGFLTMFVPIIVVAESRGGIASMLASRAYVMRAPGFSFITLVLSGTITMIPAVAVLWLGWLIAQGVGDVVWFEMSRIGASWMHSLVAQPFTQIVFVVLYAQLHELQGRASVRTGWVARALVLAWAALPWLVLMMLLWLGQANGLVTIVPEGIFVSDTVLPW